MTITNLRRMFSFWALAQAVVFTTLPAAQGAAQEPEFYDIPYADRQWTFGRRMDLSQLRYCIDPRESDWEVAGDVADAIAAALLLEPQRYVVESTMVMEDITMVYGLLLEHCDIHMGFKLIPGGYGEWASLTRAYYSTEYAFVTADPDLGALADLSPPRPIGATIGTSAHLRLVSYLTASAPKDRWPTYPMGTNQLALQSLLKGTVDVALVWAPVFWATQRDDPAYADLHAIDPAPLPATVLGVGALMLSDETFLRTSIDEAIAALTADGTFAAIYDAHGFPAVDGP